MKDERTTKQIVAWYNALHEAQRLRLAGTPDRTIARMLNDQGYVTERLKPWSGNAVKRLLQQEPPHKPVAKPTVQPTITPENPMVVELRRYRDGKGTVETEYETFASDAEWDAFKAETERARADYEAAVRKREAGPRDWLSWKSAAWSSFGDDLIQQDKYRHTPLALAGQETWLRSIFPLVMRQVQDTGKVPMDLIDQIEGQPDVKGQLRRVFFGMMRLLAQEIETGMVLREKVRALENPEDSPAAKAERDLDAWKKEHMVDLQDGQEPS